MRIAHSRKMDGRLAGVYKWPAIKCLAAIDSYGTIGRTNHFNVSSQIWLSSTCQQQQCASQARCVRARDGARAPHFRCHKRAQMDRHISHSAQSATNHWIPHTRFDNALAVQLNRLRNCNLHLFVPLVFVPLFFIRSSLRAFITLLFCVCINFVSYYLSLCHLFTIYTG